MMMTIYSPLLKSDVPTLFLLIGVVTLYRPLLLSLCTCTVVDGLVGIGFVSSYSSL